MVEAWRTWGDVVLATASLLPLAILAAIGLVAWRTRGGLPLNEARRRSLAEVGLVVGTAPWVWMGLTPRPADRSVVLVPLADLVEQLADDTARAAVQIGANLLVFFALGFFLPIRSAAWARLPRLLALAATGAVLIETLQFTLDLGRVSAVDDVLLNALGAVLGGLASRRWWAGHASPTSAPASSPATDALKSR